MGHIDVNEQILNKKIRSVYPVSDIFYKFLHDLSIISTYT